MKMVDPYALWADTGGIITEIRHYFGLRSTCYHAAIIGCRLIA